MSTTIYRKNLPRTNGSAWITELSVVRFAMASNKECKCGYQITIGNEQVTLMAKQMEELMHDLNTFFYAEGYP